MLVIRYTRVGKTKEPYYRLIVSDKRKDPWGKYLELLGTYNPRTKETKLKADRVKYWLSVGAQASDTVHNLLLKEKIIEGKFKKKIGISKTRKAKIEAEAKKAEAAKPKEEAPVAAEPVATPVEEVKAE